MQHKMPPVGTADGMFHDGNPATGEPGTIVSALWLNALQSATRNLQAEMLSVLEAAGLEIDPDEIHQLEAAIKQLAWGAQQRPTTLAGYGIGDGFCIREQLGNAVDLNTILETGLYMQGSSAYASSGYHYPVPLGGWLLVYSPSPEATSAVVQQYHAVHGSRVFIRSLESGAWSDWREFASAEQGRRLMTSSEVFVVPANVYRLCVTLAGAGGGGAGAIIGAPYVPGGGGAGQVRYREFLDVVPGQSIPVTIGAGGQGGTGSASAGSYANSNGMPGGASSFGTLLTATGGAGGACQPAHSYGGAAGGGAFAERGADGDVLSVQTLGGAGGGNILAPTMAASYGAGGTARGYGAGGCGGRAEGYWQNGAAGGAGVCIVEW